MVYLVAVSGASHHPIKIKNKHGLEIYTIFSVSVSDLVMHLAENEWVCMSVVVIVRVSMAINEEPSLATFVCQSKKKKTNLRPTWNDRSAFGSLKSYRKRAQMQAVRYLFQFANSQYRLSGVQMEMDKSFFFFWKKEEICENWCVVCVMGSQLVRSFCLSCVLLCRVVCALSVP